MSEHEKALKAGVALLERATTYALGSLRLVTPAILHRPTPCTGWTLHDLLIHLTDSFDTLAEAAAPVAGMTAGRPASTTERDVVPGASPADNAKGSGPERPMADKTRPTKIAALRAAPPRQPGSSPPRSNLCDQPPHPALRDGAAQSARCDRAALSGCCDGAVQCGSCGGAAPSGPCSEAAQSALRERAVQRELYGEALPTGLGDGVVQGGHRGGAPQPERYRGEPQPGLGDVAVRDGPRNPALLLRDSATELLGRWVALAGDELVAVGDRHLTRPMVAAVGAIEVAVHGWDVAMACGERRPMPPLLAEELLDLARLFVTAQERSARFAPALAVPPGASAHDRLLAYLGRDPAWTPFHSP